MHKIWIEFILHTVGQNKSPVVGKLRQDHQLSCLMTFDEEAADAGFPA